ncbi:hypothetical protein SNEBB_000586 [Seison nebaliae]|nr:hypothetical protein SNEBB_000586 [Seison nebaliae]
MESNEEDEKKNSHELHHLLTKREKFMSSLIAGGIAGAVAKTTIAPFDRTKINFQTNDRKMKDLPLSGEEIQQL